MIAITERNGETIGILRYFLDIDRLNPSNIFTLKPSPVRGKIAY